MGSILNFILPFEKEYPNWCFHGPLTNYIISNFDFSNDLIEGKKNILLIEPTDTLGGIIENFDYLFKKEPLYKFVQTNEIKILVGSVADPPTMKMYERFIEKIKKYKIENKYLLVTSNLQIKNNKNTYSYHYFIEEATQYKSYFFEPYENDLGYVSEEIKLSELNSNRTKKFLSFNRNVNKEHRFSLFHDYLKNDFSDSYFSFLYFPEKCVLPYHSSKTHLNMKEYESYLPIELDTQNKNFSFSTSNTFKKELFLDSCINIVTETSFHDNELFVSEKILKPILNYQPFIVFGPVNYLKELKKLGFKTFSDYWDESYDDIVSSEKRYFKVFDLILDLNKKSIEELNEIYKKTKEICIYNKKLFNSLDLDTINEFFKKIENEW